MRIALAQINPIVGDIPGNAGKIRYWTNIARKKGADLVVFPELCITGYPPRDLLEQSSFVSANLKALSALASETRDILVIVGYVERNNAPVGKPLFNAAALLGKGKVLASRHKTLLPSYDVFDEARHFEPASSNKVVVIGGKKCGITICEDAWNDEMFWPKRLYSTDPVEEQIREGGEILINIAASPFHRKKTRLRYEMLASHVFKAHAPLVFVNQVGGNDELVFDGHSFILNSKGRLLARGKGFQEDLVIADLDSKKTAPYREPAELEQIRQALVLGIKDYVRKCGFKDVLLGLSGGIDSALSCVLAVEALGKGHVTGVSMPSPYTSGRSKKAIKNLARNLGIRLIEIPIGELYSLFLSALGKIFKGRREDTTEQNLQSRIRSNILMALSNKFGMLVLSTGNKSELSVGYCTLYGDMSGGLGVLADVPKTTVYALARHINRSREIIPRDSIARAPTAELKPGQKDLDDLPPYKTLDAILEAYIGEGKDLDEIAACGFDRDTAAQVVRKVDGAEFKRAQASIGLKITPRAFGLGRRMPIARGYS